MLDWPLIIVKAFETLWVWFFSFFPALLGALVVLLIGWILATIAEGLVKKLLVKVKFNKVFEKTGWTNALAKADFKVAPDELFASLIKWVLVFVFLMAAVEILNLRQFADFLQNILAYVPRVIVASLILVIGAVFADTLEKVVFAAVERARVGHSAIAGSIVKWAIWGFTFFAVLEELRIATFLVQTMFTGLVALFVISLGLAFGIGGKDLASEILQNLKRKLQSK